MCLELSIVAAAHADSASQKPQSSNFTIEQAGLWYAMAWKDTYLNNDHSLFVCSIHIHKVGIQNEY